MQDANLFVAFAEIAGVFVGFGALISITSPSAIESSELAQIREVVSVGLMVIVAALLPVGVGRYGIAGHNLWLLCGLIFLLLNWVAIIVSMRRLDSRELMLARLRTNPLIFGFFLVFLEVSLQFPLFLIVLGLYPDLEPAFYTTALIILLFEAAFVLVRLVFSQMIPPRAS